MHRLLCFCLQSYVSKPTYKCSVWGPTCDGLDCIKSECMLPELSAGNWLMFRDMGAYTLCAASFFNGMPKPQVNYVFDEMHWLVLLNVHQNLKKNNCIVNVLLLCVF